MNSRKIDDLYFAEKKRWSEFINDLPMDAYSQWEVAINIRHSYEWLHRIAEQIRFGEDIHKKWNFYRNCDKDYESLITLHPTTRKTYCHSCNLELLKGEGMVYKYNQNNIVLCVRCDPQYDHCPICDYPMVDGQCLGKCHIHII